MTLLIILRLLFCITEHSNINLLRPSQKSFRKSLTVVCEIVFVFSEFELLNQTGPPIRLRSSGFVMLVNQLCLRLYNRMS